MKIDVYGRFRLEITKESGSWIAYKLESGRRIKLPDLVIPDWVQEKELTQYLDDLYHEASKPGDSIRIVDPE